MYEIQTYTLIDGWVNIWTVDGLPETFKTFGDALDSLDSFLDEYLEDFYAGLVPDVPDRDNYRIKLVEVTNA
jgi:hypothetical protein